MGSEMCIRDRSDNIFIKYEGNAFTNSGLDILLKKHNIEYVEVVGVDGGSCSYLYPSV